MTVVRTTVKSSVPTAPATGIRVGELLPIGALLLLGFGGYVKGSKYLHWMPVDITLLGAVLVGLLVFVRTLTGHARRPHGWFLLIYTAGAFAVGWPASPWHPYTQTKVSQLCTLVPLCVLGGAILLDTPQARRLWLWANVALGLLIAGLVHVDPSLSAASVGRAAIDGGNTIGTARGVGAAFVVLVVVALMNRTYRVWASIVAVLVATVLVDAASRGPALGAVIAIIAGVAFSARAGRSAQRTFAAVTAVVAAAYLLIKQSTTPRRLTDFNDTSTQARQVLWGRTARLITDHPLGVGWGKLWDAIPSNEALSSGYTQYPHNLFLEAGSEAGWLALVMVVVLVITTVRLQRQRATGWVEVAMFCLLLFHLVNAQVSGDITANRGLWVAFGAALAASAGDSKLRDGRVRRAYGHLRQGKRPIEIRA